MAFLANIKRSLYQKRLSSEVTKASPPREALHPDTANDIMIVFPADSADDRKVVDKWRDAHQRAGRKIRAIGYFGQDVGSANFDFVMVTPKDKNWYGIPESEAIRIYKADPTQLLIRLGPPEHDVLDYLAATKKASLKVGPYTEDPNNPYHLMYDASQSVKLKDQLATIAHIFSFTNAAAITSKV